MQSPLASPAYYRNLGSDGVESGYNRMGGEGEAGRMTWQGADSLPSRGTSFALIAVAALQAVLTSGMVFGWAPLQLMLEEEGIYANECKDGVAPCPEQGIKLQTMYTVATSAFCFCVWPTGMVLDKYGPRVCSMMGSVLFGVGCALMAISSNEQDYFVPGLTFIALGGLPIVLAMMHLSNLLPEYAGTIITLFNVCIDVSSLNFKILYEIFALGFSHRDLFLGYTIVPILIFISSIFLWPMQKYEPRMMPPAVGEGAALASQPKSTMEGQSFMRQVSSRHFILCALFTSLQLLHVNFYIGTVDDQVRELVNGGHGNSTDVALLTGTAAGAVAPLEERLYTLGYVRGVGEDGDTTAAMIIQMCSAFAWILPLGGVAMTYPVGWMLDNLSMWHCVFALSFAGFLHSLTLLVDGTYIAYGSFLLFAYYRAALFGTMATEVAFTFGHENFGKLWGVLYLTAGVLNFTIAPLSHIAKELGTFWTINASFAALGALLLVYPVWLYTCDLKASSQDNASEGSWGRDRHSLGVAKKAIEKWSKELNEGNIEQVRWEMQQTLARLLN
mmetsp:Transcript_40378/g.99170  ORF Transcript_40378/g.99170 Transcript_40378/m.99170 type:complete len:558 (+) Transcript_40378:58-1731(+)